MTCTYDLDPVALSLEERLTALCAAEREIARLQARSLRLVAAIADDPCAGSVAPELDREWHKEELRAALGESAVSVENRVELARTVQQRLPATLAALEAGTITFCHARALSEAVAGLADTEAGEVEASALPFAVGRDLAAFVRKVRREVLNLDSRTVEQRFAAALADRRVWVTAEQDGMSSFGALLPAEGAQTLMTALDTAADQCPPDDPRTRDQQRGDALVQLGIDALNGEWRCSECVARNDTAETRPRRTGLRPAVQVSVALSTLLGIDSQPAELDGYGPIPAELARRLASEDGATWRRLVTDDLGRLLDNGRSTYRPPADLRAFVLARDRTCRFPTCNRRADRCEIDHVTPWTEGGETAADNLVVLCSRHHHGKHDAGWTLRRLPDGDIEWTSPTGRTYLVPASTHPVDTTFDSVMRDDNTERASRRSAADAT